MQDKNHSTRAPLVSVSIITYNQAQFIHEALQSALSQDYKNIEVVVSDDGSTDGTAEIILEYARRHPGKVVPLVGGPNLGITGNSNRALKACQGKYIAFMGGDDTLLPTKVSKQVAWLEADKDRVLCYHDVDVYDSESGKSLYLWSQKYRFRMGNAKSVVKYGTFFAATSVMVRYPHQLHIVFNENIPTASDWLMWIEILERQVGYLGYVEGVYARYRRHPNNITSTGSHQLHDLMATIDAIEWLAPNKYNWECKQKRAEIYFLEAYKNISAKRFCMAFASLFQSLRVCRGFWIAPFRLLVAKVFSGKL